MDLSVIAGAVLGGVSGFFISKLTGKFTSGGCPILCNPKISTVYFAFLGMMMAWKPN